MRSKYLRSFVHFFTASFIVRFISFIREVLMVSIIGPGRILDIYFFLISIPNLINQIWNAPLESVLLTKYEKDLVSKEDDNPDLILAGRVSNLTIVSIVIFLIANIIFPAFIYLFYAQYFSREIIFSICVINIIIIVETYLLSFKVFKYSQKNFFSPTMLPLLQNIALIGGLLWFKDKITIFELSILFAAGSSLQIVVLFRKYFARFFLQSFARLKSLKDVALLKDSSQ